MANDNNYDYSAHENQTIHEVGIEKEITKSYIDYAMSVIVGRALPDVRDGLKPVHRRILYTMYEDRLTHDKQFRKSATTVGAVLGRYHPHGDMAVYDTMVRMAQSFSLRYPLIEGHGNFGNIDGDGAAAYRYTEARMAKIADEMLVGIEKDVVDFVPSFDNMGKEPTVLPSRFPNLLVNGSIGIAVGMATNIPPHNLGEVVDACVYMLDNPDCTIPELMNYIKGPDFPTYGTIYGTSEIYEAYMTGRGHIKVRAEAHFEEHKGHTSIIITELPYQVLRSSLLETMVKLVKDKRIEGISAIRNESGRKGMRIVVEVKKDANPQIVLNLLYKYTQMQDTCAVNMLALVDGRPRVLNLKEVLYYYLQHQEEVITRRTRFDLNKAKAEAHIFEGLKIAIDHIDEVIEIIKKSASVADAKVNLQNRFGLTELQSQAIVDMTLGKLSGLERQKIEDRLAELYALIEELEGILADRAKILGIVKDDLIKIKEKYGDARRTRITEAENEILPEDLIDRVNCVITVTRDGYIKRMPSETYQSQRRGGRGITAMTTKEEDFVKDVFVAHSHDYLLMFSDCGRLYIKKCYEIPEAGRTAKGMNMVNILSLDEGENITAVIAVEDFTDDEYLVMMTQKGIIKRVNLISYKTKRTAGLYAVTLDEGDKLLSVLKTDGEHDIIAATATGYAIKFNENEIRCVGRQARGVRGIKLSGDDVVVGAVAVKADENTGEYSERLLTVTANGFGKQTEISEYTNQNRGGKGVICHRVTDKTGKLTGICTVDPDDDVLMISDEGIIIRTKVSDIPVYGRAASGVIVMRLTEGASLSAFSPVSTRDEEEYAFSVDENSAEVGEGEDAFGVEGNEEAAEEE